MSTTENAAVTGIEKTYQDLLAKTSTFIAGNKVPQWFKPYSELVNEFYKDIAVYVKSLESKVESLESQVAVQKAVSDSLVLDREKLKITVEDQLQYSRRNMLLIHGVEEKKEENTDKIALEIANKVGCKLTVNNINRTHRLGPKKSKNGGQKKTKRPIIVSLIDYHHKKIITMKGSSVVITESLTAARYDLYKKAISAFGKFNCWTYDGKIWVSEGEDKYTISCEEDIASHSPQ